MARLAALIGLVLAVLYFLVRANKAAKAARELNRDSKGLQRRLRNGVTRLIGTPLARVNNPGLAAVILMIQLVRTGTPVTAQEKTKILELMEESMRIANSSAVFEQAWAYTTPRGFFSSVADELIPMLRERLDIAARGELIAMLTQVADALNGASDLQLEAIARLKNRLLRA
jgi:uncharacterized tellurite resistance protein B-like protein